MAENAYSMPKSRAEAKACGSKRYYTSKPCVRQHVAERVTGTGNCVVCRIEDQRRWQEANPERKVASNNAWKQRNPEKVKEARKRFKSQHPGRWRAERDAAIRRDPEGYRQKRKAIAEQYAPRKRQAEALRRADPAVLARQAKAQRERNKLNPEKARLARKRHYDRVKNDPMWKLNTAVRNGVSRCLQGVGKGGKRTTSLVPFQIGELRAHLERQFLPGMTWDNYGQWHVDHIIPLSAFNFQSSDDIDFGRAWALTNLQPLWAEDNWKKHARLAKPFQPSFSLHGAS